MGGAFDAFHTCSLPKRLLDPVEEKSEDALLACDQPDIHCETQSEVDCVGSDEDMVCRSGRIVESGRRG